jgi:hypothetical protein
MNKHLWSYKTFCNYVLSVAAIVAVVTLLFVSEPHAQQRNARMDAFAKRPTPRISLLT